MRFTLPLLLATAAETVLNHALQLAPHSSAGLASLSGKRIKIEIQALNLHFTLLPSAQSILVFSSDMGAVDACVQGPPFSLLRLLAQTDANLAQSVKIKGDIGAVQQLQKVLQQLDIDWEEQFSKLLGDLPAHSLGNLLRRGHQHLHQGLNSFRDDLEEYLQQEARHLPSAPEVEHFLTAIDHLRDDVARLEQRIQRLTKAC